jgi:phosphoribosylformylglycinamidine synthase
VGVARLPGSGRALGTALGCRPYLMRFDARVGGFDAVAYPALQLACKGFEPLAVTDCLNFGNPEKERTMTEFVASLAGMNAACEALRAPIISGNVSFYNETMGKNVTSTPSTGLIGLRHGVEGMPSSEFVAPGEGIFLLRSAQVTCGGAMHELLSGDGSPCSGRGEPSPVALAEFVGALTALGASGLVTAARAVGKFGLGYALARMCLRLSHAREGAPVGARAELAGLRAARPDADFSRGWDALFEETLYEVVLTVRDADEAWLRAEVAKRGPSLECHRLGQTASDRLSIEGAFEYPLHEIKRDYESVCYERSGGHGERQVMA